ncbi:hypothetical protein [Arthrobacter sp. 31Y]|uniref:hypothetical protein n=1 Tax=Arthrobacter sp. 31Y TaxID=1115632 RepID=UPI000465085A|nr:hypothetical protein [Arthrobacter sp. 31Y]
MYYPANKLDSRNIGSVVAFRNDGMKVHGILELMETNAESVELTLQGSEETFLLEPADQVNVILTSEAAYALHSKNALESIRDMLSEALPLIPKTETPAVLQLVAA